MMQIEEECVKVGLSIEDTLFPSKWIVGFNEIAASLG